MPIYMKHPDHGTHIVYSEQEADACRKHGWYLPDEVKDAPKEYNTKQRETLKIRKVKNDDGV